MKTRTSRVLRKLRAGDSATCMKSNLGDPRIVEIFGICGLDAIWLCNEHVPNNWLNLENQIRAARIHDMDSIIRIAKGSYSDYIKPFEADATGIMVPHVTSAGEAEEIVDTVRFQPEGRRPMDGGNTDGLYCQLSAVDYIAHSNRERLVILQIESPEGMAEVDAIAAVKGYDILMFGPGDFAHRIGKAGQIQDPEVVAARKQLAASARKHGKFLMTSGMFASRAELTVEGFQLFNIGSDVTLLGAQVNERVQAFAQAEDGNKATTSY